MLSRWFRRLVRLLPAQLAFAALMIAAAQTAIGAESGLTQSRDHPRYWAWNGEPVLLIGGTADDNLFQYKDLEAHLDELVAAGGNYVRNTMSSRDAGNVWPFCQCVGRRGQPIEQVSAWQQWIDQLLSRRPLGSAVYPRFDLDQDDDVYWARFESLLSLAREREVVVQIELWDRFDFARGPWNGNAYNPANNVNYTASESGLATSYPEHPNRNRNPFFRSIPGLDDNPLLLAYQ